MPHDVIMPALGMAQDTGKIVAWLKARGDEVAEGDPIMEVETDKATMEVVAQVAGFLIDIRASEGDDVPVGDVIAVIGASADEVADAPAPKADAPTEAPTELPSPSAKPEGREVIMPALGMAQDTGKVVGWLKKPGDQVEEGEALLEVETDKATMEVEAQGNGWLAVTYAADGEDVPVGEVIAILTAEKPDAPQALSRADAPSGGAPAPEPEEGSKATTEAPSTPAKNTPAQSHSGRILASPKARKLAAERGIDLSRLIEAGVEQPIHVADLDRASDLPPQQAAPASAPTADLLSLEAETDAAAFDAFLAWADRPATDLLAAFAAGSLRAATEAHTVTCTVETPGNERLTLTDPDRAHAAEPEATEPAFALRDLTGSRLTRVSRASAIPTLTITRRGGALTVTLDTPSAAMGEETAIALIDGLARRLEDPLRHLI